MSSKKPPLPDLSYKISWHGSQAIVSLVFRGSQIFSGHVIPHEERSVMRVWTVIQSLDHLTEQEKEHCIEQLRDALNDSFRGFEEPIPLPLQSETVEFPVDVLPDWAKDWVLEFSRIREQPVDLAASVILSVVASICQSAWTIKVRDSWPIEPFCLWIASLASSGAGKSLIVKAAIKPLMAKINSRQADYDREVRNIDTRIKAMNSQVEKLMRDYGTSKDVNSQQNALFEITNLKEEISILEASKPANPNWVFDDATTQAFRKMWLETKGLSACFSSESTFLNNVVGSKFDSARDHDGTDILRLAWDGDVQNTRRAGNQDVYTGKAYLSVLQMVQPDILHMFQKSTSAMSRGTFQRFLWFFPNCIPVGERTFPSDEPTPAVIRNYDTAIENIYDAAVKTSGHGRGGPGSVIEMHPTCYEIIQNFNREEEPARAGMDDLFISSDAKVFGGQMVRLAAILWVMDCEGAPPGPVPPDCVFRAREILMAARTHLMRAIGFMSASPATEDAHAILTWLRRQTPMATIQEKMLCRKLKLNRKWGIDRTLVAANLLVKHGYMRPIRASKGAAFNLNPSIWSESANSP